MPDSRKKTGNYLIGRPRPLSMEVGASKRSRLHYDVSGSSCEAMIHTPPPIRKGANGHRCGRKFLCSAPLREEENEDIDIDTDGETEGDASGAWSGSRAQIGSPSLMEYFVINDKGFLQLSSSVAAANGIRDSFSSEGGRRYGSCSSPEASDGSDKCGGSPMSIDNWDWGEIVSYSYTKTVS
jgi:hypothetical protein